MIDSARKKMHATIRLLSEMETQVKTNGSEVETPNVGRVESGSRDCLLEDAFSSADEQPFVQTVSTSLKIRSPF